MATNLALDDDLIRQALLLGGHKTKREAVTSALKEYIAHLKQLEIKTLFGTLEIDPDYNHKKGRKR